MKKIVLVLAVLLVSVSACKNPFLKKMLVEEESVSPAVQVPKHTITFGVEGGTGGSLKAEVDGNEITTGNLVEQGKSVVCCFYHRTRFRLCAGTVDKGRRSYRRSRHGQDLHPHRNGRCGHQSEVSITLCRRRRLAHLKPRQARHQR